MTDLDLSQTIFATTARVLTTRATPEELARFADAAALDPAVFETNPPYFFPAEISSDRMDAYWTRMDPATTLPQFAQDAQAGVAFLSGHRQWELPFGRSLTGRVEAVAAADAQARVIADFYLLPGLAADANRTSDQVITAIRGGVQRDVSVGFYGGLFRCSICGQDLMDWRLCQHWPGRFYEPADSPPGAPRVRCTATVEGARLAEVSAVYDGATPGAVILKAQDAATRGALGLEAARWLEASYRIRLPDRRITMPGGITQEPPMPPEDQTRAPEAPPPAPPPVAPAEGGADPLETVRAALAEAGIAETTDPAAAVRQLASEVARLRPLADDGQAYRRDLVDEALREGVRALGQAFAEETYRGLLATAPLETVKRFIADWRAVGDARLPGGRASVDGDERPSPAAPEPDVPNAAFAG